MTLTTAHTAYIFQAASDWYDLTRPLVEWWEEQRDHFAAYCVEEANERDSLDVHLPTLWRIFEEREAR